MYRYLIILFCIINWNTKYSLTSLHSIQKVDWKKEKKVFLCIKGDRSTWNIVYLDHLKLTEFKYLQYFVLRYKSHVLGALKVDSNKEHLPLFQKRPSNLQVFCLYALSMHFNLFWFTFVMRYGRVIFSIDFHLYPVSDIWDLNKYILWFLKGKISEGNVC